MCITKICRSNTTLFCSENTIYSSIFGTSLPDSKHLLDLEQNQKRSLIPFTHAIKIKMQLKAASVHHK